MVKTPTFKGAKWLYNQAHLSADDITRVVHKMEECQRVYPGEKVGVRPPTYIGEPHPIATVIFGPGDTPRIYDNVYRPVEARA